MEGTKTWRNSKQDCSQTLHIGVSRARYNSWGDTHRGRHMWKRKEEKGEKQIVTGVSTERDFTLIREGFTRGDGLRNKEEGEYVVGAGIYPDMERIPTPRRIYLY